MNKNAIKNFAIQARLTLIDAVSQRAFAYEVSEKSVTPANADVIAGRPLSREEKEQRRQLVAQVEAKGFRQVMEEAAYTWFNRFIALRYMEVNEYLPTGIRVFTDAEGKFSPEILKEALTVELTSLNRKQVITLLEKQDNEALYKLLLLAQCNDLGEILPGMFQRINNWTELLFPANLLKPGSVLDRMVSDIPAEDWQDQVQIIGWLYQYYNTQKKDEVFEALKKNVKITKENIPAATQLFTPDWIVRYMVENSLGRLWVEGHPDTADQLLPSEEEQNYFRETHQELDADNPKWHYYLPEAEQEPEVQAQLAEIRKEYAALTPEEIKVIDPCMGSGHILAYMFDVLMQIYATSGYSPRDAVASIVRNNIYGLDIDDRAAQLAYFSVMMKARQYDRRFLTRRIQPNVYAIQESNGIDKAAIDYFCNGDAKLTAAMKSLTKELTDAKEYGSILNITPVDFEALYSRFDEVFDEISMYRDAVLTQLLPLVKCAEAMAQKYHTLVTNPPYMGSSGMSAKLGDFVKKNYPDSKSDLFAVFIERCGFMITKNGYQAMITQHAWMFLSSFENLRKKIFSKNTVNMAHLGARAFEEIGGEVVQTTAFVNANRHFTTYSGTYFRLIEPTTQQGKEDMFLTGQNCYTAQQTSFSKIPGSPAAYWMSAQAISNFDAMKSIGFYGEGRIGLITGDANRFLRLWPEVSIDRIGFGIRSNEESIESGYKWFPAQKGGEFRRWYGNLDYIVNWENDGYEMKYDNYMGTRVRSHNYNGNYGFKKAITWTTISSGKFACRYSDDGFIYDTAGPFINISSENDYYAILGILNSVVGEYYLTVMNPTINFPPGYIQSIPYSRIEREYAVNEIVEANVAISKFDWDSFETSWDFQQHPLIAHRDCWETAGITRYDPLLKNAFEMWQMIAEQRFNQLKANEEELNRIFIDIYGLQDELTPEVEDKDVTVRKADLQRDIKSLISYAVGCMFGRYSLDCEGLAYAGGQWDGSKYTTFPADRDNIIPICDDEYFDDDIVGRFVSFIRTVYGEETLEENLKFIADALGGSGTPREVIRKYFLNDFYADHLKIYQKRPIYWLFDSGKKNGFKALIYMHRYQPDTIARIRTDYVHEQQSRYRTAIADLEDRVEHAAASERVKLNKQLAKLKDQDLELRKYEEEIHHLADQMISIDLDDGVKVNYAKFEKVLAKIK